MKINGKNIEALLFDYAEGNLSDTECKEVEKYLDLHPQYREMLSMYDPNITVQKPLEIVFDEKDNLFAMAAGQKQTKIIMISRYVKYISGIAAMFVLFFAVRMFYQNSNQAVLKQDIAKISSENTNSSVQTEKADNETTFAEQILKKEKKNKPVDKDKTEENNVEQEIKGNDLPDIIRNDAEELLANNIINNREDVSDQEGVELIAENVVSDRQEEQPDEENDKNIPLKEEYFIVNKGRKSAKEEWIKRGVNSALNTGIAQTAIEGITKVFSSSGTKKMVNFFSGRRNKRVKSVYIETNSSETSNV